MHTHIHTHAHIHTHTHKPGRHWCWHTWKSKIKLYFYDYGEKLWDRVKCGLLTAHYVLYDRAKQNKKFTEDTNSIHGNCNWAQCSIGGLLFWIAYCHSWEAEPVQDRYCPFMAFQLVFSFPVIRRQPSLGCGYFTLWVSCKLKGILARIRQPNANNPHLGETVHCYPGKHEHLLVTHSKQKCPVREERPAVNIRKRSMVHSRPHSLLSLITAHCQEAPLYFLLKNVTSMGHLKVSKTFISKTWHTDPKILLCLEMQPNDTQLLIPNSRNPKTWVKLWTRWEGLCFFYWLLTRSASYSSEAFKMFSKHTSLNYNVNSIYWKVGTFNMKSEPI